MGESQCPETFFFNSVVLAVLLWRAYRNLWPSGLNVLKITMIMWKNNATVQTGIIVCCAVQFIEADSSVLYHKSLPWGPKLGRW